MTSLRRALLVAPLLTMTFQVPAQLTLRDDVTTPTLHNFTPLPAPDAQFSSDLEALVKDAGLDAMTPAAKNPDEEDEWASICVVDLTGPAPRVAEWKGENFIYPASTYKMYVVGEAVRRVVEGKLSLDDRITVDPLNWREGTALNVGEAATLSDLLRLTCQYSDNTAASVTVDVVDRQRVSALMRALGCFGSDVTRKFVPRPNEPEEYRKVPGTTTCGRHLATFLWAVESGAIGGGRGRGLIKAYLSMIANADARFRGGLPTSATVYSKTGEWDTFTGEAALIEDGDVKYILCALTPFPREEAEPKLRKFAQAVHAMMQRRQAEAR